MRQLECFGAGDGAAVLGDIIRGFSSGFHSVNVK